jgi:hypothetical protein
MYAKLWDGFTIVSHNCEVRSSTDVSIGINTQLYLETTSTHFDRSIPISCSALKSSTADRLAPQLAAHVARAKRDSPSGERKFMKV